MSKMVLLALAGCSLCSCGYIEGKSHRENFYAATAKSKTLGVINFKSDPNEKPIYTMDVKKVQRGYALQAPLYDDNDGFVAQLAYQRDKEFSSFTGLQISYGF